jgi:hypothetical protein
MLQLVGAIWVIKPVENAEKYQFWYILADIGIYWQILVDIGTPNLAA